MNPPIDVTMRHEAIIAAYQSGEPIPEIARRFGHGVGWIRFILTRADVIKKPAIFRDPTFLSRAVNVAAEIADVTPEAILSASRTKEAVRARFAVMYACRQRGMSFNMIARRFNRDHSSVVYDERQALNLAARDADYAKLLIEVDAA